MMWCVRRVNKFSLSCGQYHGLKQFKFMKFDNAYYHEIIQTSELPKYSLKAHL
jgi:hypothetical protein